MKKLLILAGMTALSLPALAQTNHFPDQKWKETQIDHFTIRTQGVSATIAKKYAKKVWEICDRTMPGLKEEYTNNTFQTPSGEAGSNEKPYRFTIYLVKYISPFTEMVDKVVATAGDRAVGLKKVCLQTKMLSDSKHRYVVFCMEERKGEIDALLVHSMASAILAGHARMKGKSFFHTAGFGYYAEHLVFKKCRVHYLDFSRYYDDNEVVRSEALDGSSPWPRPIQKMVKKDDVKVRLQEIFTSSVDGLDPPRSGLLMALAHFMCHSEENVKKHHNYLKKLRDGESASVELILECYGYDSVATFDTAFKEYIESRNFR